MPRGRNERGAREPLPSLFARASAQTVEGASLLFARLDANNSRIERAQREQAAAALMQLAERVRAGLWNDEIAQIVARISALDDTPAKP